MTKANEKRERFIRLATYRTNEIIKRIKVLGNCANRSAYEYAQDDVEKIFAEIRRKLKEIEGKFHFPHDRQFKL